MRVLRTDRLLLRPFTPGDIDAVAVHCNDFEFARTTAALPFPYARHHAEEWIASHRALIEQNRIWPFAIERKEDSQLIGSIEIRFEWEHRAADLGYGIYRPFWRNGYATEAARAVITEGFDRCGLNRVHAHHFSGNPASGRVLEKCGMTYEGTMRQRVCRFGVVHDAVHYAILRSDDARGQEKHDDILRI